ncbi:MAG: MBOAT family O-acyltransferase [Methanocorpusculum sp.]|nr:MBOAT family O-acyltransferase [Methanocorpusculum sp.]
MLFTTPEFFIFLIIVIIGIELIRKQLWQHLFLLIASYFFYWWSGSIHILLLVFVTLASFYCGYKIFNSKTKKNKRIWLIIGTIIPLAILAYFKYIDWGIESINSIVAVFGVTAQIPLLNIALPVGISFFTFQALSYVFDIYLGKLEPEPKLYKYALFIAFFPALVAGPIVRASEFLPQLKNKIRITSANLQAGVTLIIWGLFKKMVIADNIGRYVDFVYSSPSTTTSIYLIAATILFGIQIYCDFSGYAHIAIGCARIFGFKIPENFDLPYLARNIQVFWRKWHMTLSRFIRDYVYIPLGGNRKGHLRTYLNLFASMAICGLWHGAAWTFVIWGAYHGILLMIHRFFVGEKKIGTKNRFLNSNAGLFLCILTTQIFVFFGWMIFRANSLEDLAVCIQKIIFFDFAFTTSTKLAFIAGIALIVIFFVLMFSKRFASAVHNICYFDYLGLLSNQKIRYWIIYVAVFTALIILLSPPETPEFIYFAF